jgi:hypothetical protein
MKWVYMKRLRKQLKQLLVVHKGSHAVHEACLLFESLCVVPD